MQPAADAETAHVPGHAAAHQVDCTLAGTAAGEAERRLAEVHAAERRELAKHELLGRQREEGAIDASDVAVSELAAEIAHALDLPAHHLVDDGEVDVDERAEGNP